MSASVDISLQFEQAYLVLRDHPSIGIEGLARAIGVEPERARRIIGKALSKFAVSPTYSVEAVPLFDDASMLQALRDAAAANDGNPLAGPAYTKFAEGNDTLPSRNAIIQRYGTWGEALTAAGLDPVKPIRSDYERRWNEQQIVLCVADAILATHSASARAYAEWAVGRDNAPSQPRITAGLTWSELVGKAYLTFAEGGARRTQYLKVLSTLTKERRGEINALRGGKAA